MHRQRGVIEKMLFTHVLRIRMVEERIGELFKRGRITMPVHLSIGQEAVAAGVIGALENQDDLVFSTHRCHGHYIAKGGSLKKMFAELYGGIEGCARGMGGTMHLSDDTVGMKLSAPIVGASIALGVGAALAAKLQDKRRLSVIFFGDGAVEEGIFWESLNFATVHKLPVLFCCENNGYATHSPISVRQPTSDIYPRVVPQVPVFHIENGNDANVVYDIALKAITQARTLSPVFLEIKTYRLREHWGVGEDWHLGYRAKEEADRWPDPLMLLRQRCQACGIPVNMLDGIEETIQLEIDEAVLFAEQSLPRTEPLVLGDVIHHDTNIGNYDWNIRENCSYKEAASDALLRAMEKDPSVFLLGEGVDAVMGVYGHVLECHKRFGEKRVIDTPLSENGLTGIAVGAALCGMRPVLIHQRNDFMLLAMDQMMNQAAKMSALSGGIHSIPLTVLSFIARKPGEGGQHSQSLHSVFAHFPGIFVGMPASAYDAGNMLFSAIMSDTPTIILEHRELFSEKVNTRESMSKQNGVFGATVSAGNDITVIALSVCVRDALEVRACLAKEHISVEVIDIRWVRPLDINTIIESVKKTKHVVVVDVGWPHCGIAAEIISTIAERALSFLASAPIRITMHDTPCPASPHVTGYHPTVFQIMSAVRKSLLGTKRTVL